MKQKQNPSNLAIWLFPGLPQQLLETLCRTTLKLQATYIKAHLQQTFSWPMTQSLVPPDFNCSCDANLLYVAQLKHPAVSLCFFVPGILLSHLVCLAQTGSLKIQENLCFWGQPSSGMIHKCPSWLSILWRHISLAHSLILEDPRDWALGVHSSNKIYVACFFSFPASSSCFFAPISWITSKINHLHSALFSCSAFGKTQSKISML